MHWIAEIVTSYYIRRGSKVRCALLDMSKTLNMVDHGYLFDLVFPRLKPPTPSPAFPDSMVLLSASSNCVQLSLNLLEGLMPSGVENKC